MREPEPTTISHRKGSKDHSSMFFEIRYMPSSSELLMRSASNLELTLEASVAKLTMQGKASGISKATSPDEPCKVHRL